MTVEQAVALVGGVTALVVAIGGLFVQLRLLRRDLNGRLAELLETTRMSARKEGELRGRDYMRGAADRAEVSAEGSVSPLHGRGEPRP